MDWTVPTVYGRDSETERRNPLGKIESRKQSPVVRRGSRESTNVEGGDIVAAGARVAELVDARDLKSLGR